MLDQDQIPDMLRSLRYFKNSFLSFTARSSALSVTPNSSTTLPKTPASSHQVRTSGSLPHASRHSNPSLISVGGAPLLHSRGLSTTDLVMADARYCVEYAKSGRSSCKKCKQQIEKGAGRIGKITANPFSDDGGEMKAWHHMRCMFEVLKVWCMHACVCDCRKVYMSV